MNHDSLLDRVKQNLDEGYNRIRFDKVLSEWQRKADDNGYVEDRNGRRIVLEPLDISIDTNWPEDELRSLGRKMAKREAAKIIEKLSQVAITYKTKEPSKISRQDILDAARKIQDANFCVLNSNQVRRLTKENALTHPKDFLDERLKKHYHGHIEKLAICDIGHNLVKDYGLLYNWDSITTANTGITVKRDERNPRQLIIVFSCGVASIEEGYVVKIPLSPDDKPKD